MENRLKNRETLKSYFQKGRVPTEEQFAALIDSSHNIHEDGCLAASENDGLILYPTGKGQVLASLFNKHPLLPDARPLWRISLAEDSSLVIGSEQGVTVLIGTDGNVTLPEELKNDSTDCKQENRDPMSPDREGIIQVKSDGLWHDLPVEAAVKEDSNRCRVYRISACWYHPGSGKYSFCEAIASHSGSSRCKVTSSRKHWWGWSGRIKIRWQILDRKLYLQMRSRRSKYGEENISCRIEKLWDI